MIFKVEQNVFRGTIENTIENAGAMGQWRKKIKGSGVRCQFLLWTVFDFVPPVASLAPAAGGSGGNL